MLKDNAKKIITRVNDGEEVITTVIHVAEVANILEVMASLPLTREIIEDILNKESIHILTIEKKDFRNALEICSRYPIGLNDGIAYRIMQEKGLTEIYSFDKHFDNLNITRYTS